jgi:hypothetical protein
MEEVYPLYVEKIIWSRNESARNFDAEVFLKESRNFRYGKKSYKEEYIPLDDIPSYEEFV